MKKKMVINKYEILSYAIPTVGMLLLVIYSIMAMCVDDIKSIQSSEGFAEMLKTAVTFISIVLSIFGFLIPAFLSSKGSSMLIQFFLDNVDMDYFVKKLKDVVAVGLIDVLLTSMLLLNDIMSTVLLNVLLAIWIWFVLYFMCVSYRFISILISIMIDNKKINKKQVVNEASEETVSKLKGNVRKI